MHSCRTEVIHTLGSVDDIELRRGFQFDEDRIADQKIDKLFANNDIILDNVDSSLLHDGQAGPAQFVRWRIFIDLLQKPAAKLTFHSERTTDDLLRHCIQHGPIRVHLRPFAFICVQSFLLPTLASSDGQRVDSTCPRRNCTSPRAPEGQSRISAPPARFHPA
jgi:hypothetical protein